MVAKSEIIKDPVHGYIRVYAHELKIIDTPAFQRLRRIKQNTGADFVYPGAVHSRFSHSLGVMHIAGVFTKWILDQAEGIDEATKSYYYFLMRLWGLTHDIGQGPFSHLFDETILSSLGTDHEKQGAELLRNSETLPRRLRIASGHTITMRSIADLLEVKTIEDWPLDENIGRSDVNEKALFYVGHGAFSADLMDYVLRDSYFTGAGYGNIDWHRLVYSSIPKNDKICLDVKAEEAFDSLILARLFLFSTVYYHRTTRAVLRVMKYFLEDAASHIDFQDFVDDLSKYESLDEESLLHNPALTECEHRNRLIKRQIPYGTIKQVALRIEDLDTSGFLEEEVLTQATRARLPPTLQDLSSKAFFVDTPKIAANPLLGEDYIHMFDRERRNPIYSREVKKARWGTLTNEMCIIRLYVHDDYKQHASAIINAFPQRGRGQTTFF
jgi:HD superfamily phosphohydrolase